MAEGRLKDVLYLDLALEAAVRTAVEGQLSNISKMPPAAVAAVTSLGLENLVLSAGNNEELVFCLKAWREVEQDIRNKNKDWPLKAKSTADRIRSILGDASERCACVLAREKTPPQLALSRTRPSPLNRKPPSFLSFSAASTARSCRAPSTSAAASTATARW